MSKVSEPITREEAEALFNEIAGGLANVEATIIEAIRRKAWVPLGYPTFVDAWNDRLKGVNLARLALKAHVVYAALGDGLDEQEVSTTIGVGIEIVSQMAEQRKDGVPPEGFTMVRRHVRRKEREPDHVLKVEFSPGQYSYLQKMAKQYDIDLAGEARTATWERVGEIIRERES